MYFNAFHAGEGKGVTLWLQPVPPVHARATLIPCWVGCPDHFESVQSREVWVAEPAALDQLLRPAAKRDG